MFDAPPPIPPSCTGGKALGGGARLSPAGQNRPALSLAPCGLPVAASSSASCLKPWTPTSGCPGNRTPPPQGSQWVPAWCVLRTLVTAGVQAGTAGPAKCAADVLRSQTAAARRRRGPEPRVTVPRDRLLSALLAQATG